MQHHEFNRRATLFHSVFVNFGVHYVFYACVYCIYYRLFFVPEQPVFVFYPLFPDKDTTLWHSVLFMEGFELTPQPNEVQLAS